MKRKKLLSFASALVAGLVLPFSAQASFTSIGCSSSDYACQPGSNVVNNTSSGTDAIGAAGSPTPSWCAILMFPLPAMPPGQIVGDQSSLTVTFASGTGASLTMNGDLWGIANFRTNPPAFNTTPDGSYWYYLVGDTGPGSNSTPTDVKIMNNFLTPSIAHVGSNATTSFAGTNALQTYIQGFYTANPSYNPANGQAYVWLRINCDAASTSTANRYVITAGDASANKPTLILEQKLPVNPLVWSGNVSSSWDFTNANWTSNGLPNFLYQDGDTVQFDTTLTGSSSVTLNTTVNPGPVIFNGATNYLLSGTGKISGTNGIYKQGSGTVIVDTANDYTGGTSISGGTLQVGNNDTNGSLGSGTITAALSGTTLAFNRTDPISTPTIAANGAGPNIVVNSGTVSLEGTDDNAGTGATVNSNAVLILNKPSSSAVHALGNTSIINAGGTLKLSGSGGDQIYKNVSITDNGLLDLAGTSEGFNALSGNGVISNSVAAESVLELGDGNTGGTFNGTIINGAGVVDVVKAGTGTQILSGTNTYTGLTTVNGFGPLVVTTAAAGGGDYFINDGGAFGVAVTPPSLSMNINNFTLGFTTLGFVNLSSTSAAPINANNLTVNDTVTVNITSGNFTVGQIYPLISYTNFGGSPTFVLGAVPSGIFGELLTSSSPISFHVTSVPLTWNGDVSSIWDTNALNWKVGAITGLSYHDGGAVNFDDTAAGSGVVNLTVPVSPVVFNVTNDAKSYSISGSGSINGSVQLTKSGTNVLILDTDNTYSGGTVLSGGTIQVGNNDAHGSIGTGAFTNLVPGSILAFNRTDSINVGTITRTTVNNSAQIVVNSGTVNLTGSADNAGTLATVNSGGTLVLAKASGSAAHALSGLGLLINPGGIMALGGSGNDQIYTASGLIDNGAFDLAGHSEGFDLLTGAGAVASSVSGAVTLTLGENNGSSAFAGTIGNGSGTLALTKAGSGILTLTGSNTYTGATAVNVGKLVTSSASTGAGAYTVANGATLAVNAAAGASLNMSSLTLATTATSLKLQNLNSASAAAISTGSVAVNGAVSVKVTSGTLTAGQDYPVLAYTSKTGTGAFSLGALPAGVTATLNSAASPISLHINGVVNLTPTNITASVTNGVLTLQWPADHTGFSVQSNSIDLGNQADWFTIAGSSNANFLNVPLANGPAQVFYRLKY